MATTSTNQHARQEIQRSPNDDSNTNYWVTAAVLFVIVVAAGLFFLVRPLLDHTHRFEQRNTLLQLEAGLENYRTVYGDYPPNSIPDEIQTHVNSVWNEPLQITADLGSLDEREALCFWLSGDGWKLLKGDDFESEVCFDFDHSDMTDDDNDGWPEYVDGRGNYYILQDGKPYLFDQKDGTRISAEDLADNRR